jgi:Ca2+-binding RTX toxin-like protein
LPSTRLSWLAIRRDQGTSSPRSTRAARGGSTPGVWGRGRGWRGEAGWRSFGRLCAGIALNDTLSGTEGEDYLKGRAGNDYLDAAGGNDTIEGGSRDDRIIPGEGDDVVLAGAGNDRTYARDTASEDVIDCGGGFDKVETIHRDDITKSNCERALGPRKGNID